MLHNHDDADSVDGIRMYDYDIKLYEDSLTVDGGLTVRISVLYRIWQ